MSSHVDRNQFPHKPSRRDAYQKLQVIERMEIGPVEIEPKRLKMPYRLFQDGREHVNVLIYRYGEKVFDTASPADRNLAAMVGAQVGLNYGIFCRKIVFHDAFDAEDRRFIQEMMENTSREIYVNKLLKPNPFLTGVAVDLPAVIRERYTNAEIVFINDFQPTETPEADETTTKFAVLSSGGKDSLLSYGLLNELGFETHPIFGNESGRHWFTAINCWRHFEANIPNTTRVWMNADRIFNWMLRRMPFIRQDFNRVRADIYPLRLWTVAVFLFGAIPLLRRRGIGNLVIGDEFDTTIKTAYKGIEHYDGLYDQSRYFDQAVSSYFAAKAWHIRQFSMLRTLSELLILKILCQRYPELQQHQISCHAAHLHQQRVYPCGKCEKCRRIITMLTAIGSSPRRCGFKEDQLSPAIQYVIQHGLHQEDEAQEQLLYMLLQRGSISAGQLVNNQAKEHPEVLGLRFHPENSRPDDVPEVLRKPLFDLLASDAATILAYTNKRWRNISRDEIDLPEIFD